MPAPSSTATAAHLLIRAAAQSPGAGARMQALLQRLRVRCGLEPDPGAGASASIDIRDLQGRRVLELREARPPLDLDLPAGTYHVSIAAGEQRRRYTIVLEPGACLELRVHATARALAA